MDNGEQKTEKMFLCFLFSHRLFQALVDRSILGFLFMAIVRVRAVATLVVSLNFCARA